MASRAHLANFEHHDFQIVGSDIGKILRMTSQINQNALSCLWFDVGRMLFSNVPFVLEVGFLNPQSRKVKPGNQPSSKEIESQMLHAFANLLRTCMFANRGSDFTTPEYSICPSIDQT